MVGKDDITAVALLRVRGGFLLGSRQFDFESAVGSDERKMSLFLRQFYADQQEIPPQILVNYLPDDLQMIASGLSEQRGAKVSIGIPRRGEKSMLLQMAVQNGRKALQECSDRRDDNQELLRRLQKRLGMRHPPQRIECFDNSNLAGTAPVSAMVVFEQGAPNPSGYRHYRLKTGIAGDDYAYMFEVLHRRLGKGPESDPLPDLLLVDGGKGQLNVALAVLEALGLKDRFSVAGIAKKNEALGEKADKIFLPGRANPLPFGKDADLLLFLQRVRDEAHRSAIGYQRKTRGKQSLVSSLDGLTGIGPKRKASLLRHFGSMDGIRAATVEDLSRVPGISMTVARTIQAAFADDRTLAGVTADRR
jgi:excinuclease ABC subunit C